MHHKLYHQTFHLHKLNCIKLNCIICIGKTRVWYCQSFQASTGVLACILPITDGRGVGYCTFISDFLQDMSPWLTPSKTYKSEFYIPQQPQECKQNTLQLFPCEICQQILLNPSISILPDSFYLHKQYLISWTHHLLPRVLQQPSNWVLF